MRLLVFAAFAACLAVGQGQQPNNYADAKSVVVAEINSRAQAG